MNWLRSTTFCATVPSQTDAAINRTSATSAPMPGEGVAEDCARSDSTTVGLRRAGNEVLFDLHRAEIVVADHIVGQHEAEHRANGPRHNDPPENPVWEAKNVGQSRNI